MIPIMGTMIGAYIIVQCVTIAARSGERSEYGFARFLAGVCAIAMLFGIMLLWQTSAQYERETKALSAPFNIPN